MNEEIKNSADLYDKVKELALMVAELKKSVINISGFGTPVVLLTEEGFNDLFPLGAPSELKKDEDGQIWEFCSVEADGVCWTMWHKISDGE